MGQRAVVLLSMLSNVPPVVLRSLISAGHLYLQDLVFSTPALPFHKSTKHQILLDLYIYWLPNPEHNSGNLLTSLVKGLFIHTDPHPDEITMINNILVSFKKKNSNLLSMTLHISTTVMQTPRECCVFQCRTRQPHFTLVLTCFKKPSISTCKIIILIFLENYKNLMNLMITYIVSTSYFHWMQLCG